MVGERPPNDVTHSHTRRWTLAVLILLGLVFVARVALTYPIFSATYDEGFHIAAGIDHYQNREFGIYYWNPPLARYCLGLLPYLNGIRLPEGERKQELALNQPAITSAVLWEAGDYWSTLTLARIGTLAFLPLLLFSVFRWSASIYGRQAGVVACVLITCASNVIAHGGLATVDFGAAATVTAAAFFLHKWFKDLKLSSCLVAALTFAAALSTKFSAAVFLAPIVGAYLLISRLSKHRVQRASQLDFVKRFVPHAVLFVFVIWCFLWIVYAFQTREMDPSSARLHAIIGRVSEPDSPLHQATFRATSAVLTWIMPPMDFVLGLHKVMELSEIGHPSFLLGETSQLGRWYYFPVALAFKTSLPLLLLVVLALGLSLFDPRKRETLADSAPLLAAIVMIPAVAMLGNLDIGLRYILPLFPFLAVLASGVFTPPPDGQKHRVLAVAMVLLTWHVGESFATHPDYLSHFNALGRGREEQLLGDSNIDWGQDLGRLSSYLAEHEIDEIHLGDHPARGRRHSKFQASAGR